ncbi:MFS transporter [Arsenicicoccus sp. oral taxon 190]|uniref:MFS transporter n=1 Tax=Arsenicicoccus sp. oral taxon 190 TaxID=1658671 RepID=UPI00067A36E4|nr:MFS transporter [Arsenicicoccus sp. oral taxon 190]AKT52344.1 hypothetical protein ADJ73_15590 [Arsenicicoccus sp. oral taxon 190]
MPALEVLRLPSFAWYFTARSISWLGTSMVGVALAFAVLGIGDASALAQVLAARTVALCACLLVGGAVGDRVSRRLVLQVSHALTALTQGAAAYLLITGQAEVWHLLVLESLNGAVSAFTMPAMQGIIPQVGPRSPLQQANSLIAFSRNGLLVLGPSLGALLVVTSGPGWALAINATTYLLALACLSRLRLPHRPRSGEPTTMLDELREGWGAFRSRRWLWVIVLAFGVLNAIHTGAWGVLGPVVATSDTHLGARGWGLAVSAEATGTVLVTLVLLRVPLRRPLLVGVAAIAGFAVPLVSLGLRAKLWPLLLASMLGGLGMETFGVGWNLAMTHEIPEHLLSRVSAYDMLGSFLAMPAGQLAFGWLGSRHDPHLVLLWAAAVFALVSLATLLVRDVRDLRCDPTAASGTPLSSR